MRRVLPVLLALVLALGTVGCGRAYSGSVGGHHFLSKAFCALSVYSAYRDVKEHRLGWAAFQALLAHHNCTQAFRRPAF